MEQRPLTPEGASRLGTEGDPPPPNKTYSRQRERHICFFKAKEIMSSRTRRLHLLGILAPKTIQNNIC